MKKNYLVQLCLMAVLCLTSSTMYAQGSRIYLGYAKPTDQIWPYDGFSFQEDARVGVAIKITRDMMREFVGGNLAEVLVGWDSEEVNGNIDLFVRRSFDGENLAEGKATLTFGWNSVELDEPLTLPDCDELYIGYYVNLKKGVCSIPFLYPYNQPGSCYLWDEKNVDKDGKEIWEDGSEGGPTMAIIGVINDSEGKFGNRIVFTQSKFDGLGVKGELLNTMVRMRNVGSNNVESIEVSAKCGDEVWSQEVNMQRVIEPTQDLRVYLPFKALGTGENKFWISKVNGVAKETADTLTHSLIAVPADVAERYTMRNLVEFWTSENSYQHVTYFEDYAKEYLTKYADKITLINQHTDDQFMVSNDKDDDEALRLYLDFMNNDYARVSIPAFTFNRAQYAMEQVGKPGTVHFPTPYPQYGDPLFGELVKTPTFASVNATTELSEDSKELKIKVNGDVAEGVMPTGEPLFLTVYLMEYDVESDSQTFWDDKQGSDYKDKYTHCNVIRLNLTPLYGEQLKNASGAYNWETTVPVGDFADIWNVKNLGVVAFLNRGSENPNINRQVINSCETRLFPLSGIDAVTADNDDVTGLTPAAVYNAAGVRLDKVAGKGVYLMEYHKNGKRIVKKVMVK